jgi:hypothetical protein
MPGLSTQPTIVRIRFWSCSENPSGNLKDQRARFNQPVTTGNVLTTHSNVLIVPHQAAYHLILRLKDDFLKPGMSLRAAGAHDNAMHLTSSAYPGFPFCCALNLSRPNTTSVCLNLFNIGDTRETNSMRHIEQR